jgi:hypothetical protein
MILPFLAQAGADSAVNVFHTLADRGPWALAVFLVLVNIATSYALFKFFTKQLDSKEATNRAFADAWERQTAAFNRRTRAENSRTEMEALQFAARTDLHPDLKQAASQVIQKIKDQSEEETAAPVQR